MGWGTYAWIFDEAGTRAEKLAVYFQGAVPLDRDEAAPVLGTMAALAHPWCALADLRRAFAPLEDLEPLQTWLSALTARTARNKPQAGASAS